MARFERALGWALVLNPRDAARTRVWVSAGILPDGDPISGGGSVGSGGDG